jgi:hypothetical protein
MCLPRPTPAPPPRCLRCQTREQGGGLRGWDFTIFGSRLREGRGGCERKTNWPPSPEAFATSHTSTTPSLSPLPNPRTRFRVEGFGLYGFSGQDYGETSCTSAPCQRSPTPENSTRRSRDSRHWHFDFEKALAGLPRLQFPSFGRNRDGESSLSMCITRFSRNQKAGTGGSDGTLPP